MDNNNIMVAMVIEVEWERGRRAGGGWPARMDDVGFPPFSQITFPP